MFKKSVPWAAAAALLLSTGPAMAHHAMGGAVPSTVVSGLLSGLGHPIIGIDHFAFVVAVGLAATFTARPFLSPLAFIVATVLGCLLLVGGVALPLAEIVVAGSVVLLGGLVLSGTRVPASAYVALFAVAGLFHGWAYGASIVGAETTPFLAYLVGFAAVQYGIAAAVVWITRSVWRAAETGGIEPRLAGAVTAGVGAAFLIENLESLAFA